MIRASHRLSRLRRSLGHRGSGRIRTLLLTSGLAAAAACGGGGSVPAPEGPTSPPGIQGRILLTDQDLGRVAEQEPNDSRAQSYQLPPVAARTRMEVTGEVGTTDARFGVVDPIDVFRFRPLAAQEVTVALHFPATDPVGGGDNELEFAAYAQATGELLNGRRGSTSPLILDVIAGPDQGVELVVTCQSGHAWYVLSIAMRDIAGSAPPAPTAVPTAARGGDAVAPRTPASDGAGGEGYVLVRLRAGRESEAAVVARIGLKVAGRTGGGSWRLKVPAGLGQGGEARTAAEWAHALSADPDVAWAEPDYVVRPLADPQDPELARQWNLHAITAPDAWETTRGDPGVIVGIVDTGIVDHPDLAGRVAPGYDFISLPEKSGDGDGRDADPTDPGDQYFSSGQSSWHGTHVGGIVAASGAAGQGLLGVAPLCQIMPLRSLGIDGGVVSDVADAILFAAGLLTLPDGRVLDPPLPIVNMSLGLGVDSAELKDACERAAAAGVLLIASAGNDGRRSVLYPAKYPGVMAVAAVGADLNTASYSNFGEDVDVSAPGGVGVQDLAGDGWPDAILSALVDETVHPRTPSLGYIEGTSQAAPHVAGVAALLLSVDRGLSASEVKTYLVSTALDRGAEGEDLVYGSGLVQARAALDRLLWDLDRRRTGDPRLHLTRGSVEFHGFETWHGVPVMNTGVGYLVLEEPTVATDDGAPWLRASNEPAHSGLNSNVAEVTVALDRHMLPAGVKHLSGTVFLRDATRTVGTIRVVVHVGVRLMAGMRHVAAARDAADGGVRAITRVSPANDYRYWILSLSAGSYKIMGGTDQDGDGFICEAGDACGWYGGPTETDASVVGLTAFEPTMLGADVYLRQE